MRLILIAALAFIFNACDPMDDRMTFQNKTDDNIFVRFCFIENGRIYGSVGGLGPVDEKERKIIGIRGTWEAEFRRLEPIQQMHVIVYNNYDFLADPFEQSSKVKSDSLLRIGDYKYKKYSYKELVSRDWKIVYPDNGFEEGVPLQID